MVPKLYQSRKRFQILGAAGRLLTGDDVIGMTNRESIDFDVASPCCFKGIYPVGCKDEVEVEWPVPQLNEILAASDFSLLLRTQRKTQLLPRKCQSCAIFRRLLDKEIGDLCCVWEP